MPSIKREAWRTPRNVPRRFRSRAGRASSRRSSRASARVRRAARAGSAPRGDSRLVPLVEEALSMLGGDDSMLRARLLARLAGALRDQPSLEPRSSLAVKRWTSPAGWMTRTRSSTHSPASSWRPGGPRSTSLARSRMSEQVAEKTRSPDAALDALTSRSVVAWLTLADRGREHGHAYDAWPDSSRRPRRSGRARCRTRSGPCSVAISSRPRIWRRTRCGRDRAECGRRLLIPAGDVHPPPFAGPAARGRRTSSAERLAIPGYRSFAVLSR